MRLAILSDVHANLPALEAVLAAIARSDVDETWCLGDIVGYGAKPDDCARLVSELCEISLIGNHDLAVLGELDVGSFSPAAAAAVKWTRSSADPETLEYLRGLEPAAEDRDPALYHGSPRDPVWEYVLWPDQAAECIAEQAQRVSLVGHSHIALFFTLDDPAGDEADGQKRPPREPRGAQAGAETVLELAAGRWLINPGSVGQPRDGDPRAAWLELDTETWLATYHRNEYDIDLAAAALADTGLPDQLGKRLYAGQ